MKPHVPKLWHRRRGCIPGDLIVLPIRTSLLLVPNDWSAFRSSRSGETALVIAVLDDCIYVYTLADKPTLARCNRDGLKCRIVL